MRELFKSKKFLSALFGALAQIVILVLNGLFIEFPEELLWQVMVAVGSLFGLQIVSQGYADGQSRGLTSSKGDNVAEALKNGLVIESESWFR